MSKKRRSNMMITVIMAVMIPAAFLLSYSLMSSLEDVFDRPCKEVEMSNAFRVDSNPATKMVIMCDSTRITQSGD